ncbi:uncharacterized protein SO_1864 [Shewanella oneidensis MR-1]|uniref:Uncharacterized protein n=1 Tax=Shewanella oneidensis (strain ATCC 700550 / JCM 31522 / CIP 106686 / LMG 19005 / NCIMB 14063 / MR-1) TaxID=211586 RepID=Q8EFV1_SHEON|nr:uncharacterized protein SO_1864 [Shewanella oneidensis MR-1]
MILITMGALAACAPVPRDYYKPFYEDGEVVSTGCGGSGPSNTIRIPLVSGLNVELKTFSSKRIRPESIHIFYLYSKVSAPQDISFQLADEYVIVKDNNSVNSWKLPINYLSTNKNNYLGQSDSIIEREFNGFSDEEINRIEASDRKSGYIQVPALSEIVGKTYFYEVGSGRKRYFNTGMSFSIQTSEITSELENFSIIYPEIIINGVKVNLGEIRFKRVRYIGIDPLNC